MTQGESSPRRASADLSSSAFSRIGGTVAGIVLWQMRRNRLRSPQPFGVGGFADAQVAGLLLIVLGVVANNVVYLQDLWLGQAQISLDGWRSYVGLLVSLGIIVVGMALVARSRHLSDASPVTTNRPQGEQGAGSRSLASSGSDVLWS